MKRITSLLLLCLSLTLTNVEAQSTSSFFDNLEGSWVGKGTLFGTPATFTMNWQKVLSGKFTKLDFSNSYSNQEGKTQGMQSEAYYRLDGSTPIGHWFDTRGVSFALKYSVEDNVLTVLWGDPKTEEGKTEYSLVGPNQVRVKDYVLRDGNFSQFGEAVYDKK